MRRFLFKCAAFLLLLLGSYAVLFALVVGLHRRALEHCRVGDAVHAVMLGDSHAMWAIDDAQIPGLRNISLNAEGYRYTYAKLSYLLQHEPHIERIYLTVGPHNFSGYFDEYITGDSFKFFVHRYLSVMDASDYVTLMQVNLRGFPELLKKVVAVGFMPGVRGKCELYGAFPDDHERKVFDPESARRRLDSQFFLDGRVIGESVSNVTYLERIVTLCRERGVRLTIVSTPMHERYVQGVPAHYKQRLADFIANHNLEYYHFAGLDLPDSAYLPDGDHLNYDGAMRATAEFGRYHGNR